MVEVPTTRYAEAEGISLAYQVFGAGEHELVCVPGGISHVDLAWQDRRYTRFMERLGSFARVTVFDKRGMGASDPVVRPPTLQERTDDIRIVMDTVGVERAALFGLSEGSTSTAVFAATFPERTEALVLCGAFPGRPADADSDPDFPAERLEQFFDRTVEPWKERFGRGATIELFAPNLAGNERAVAAMAAVERAATTPSMFRALLDSLRGIDVRPFLSSISAPTLVVHRREEPVPVEGARYLARHIPDARLVELEGNDHLPWLGDMDALVDEVETFLTGAEAAHAERRVASILFTDIVGSTEAASRLGDRRWRELIEDYHDAAARTVERHGGRVVKWLGDGLLAVFDGPARAISCADEAVHDAPLLGVDLRAGVHTGECELIGEDIGGIAVHVGARIAALAGPGEVLVSSTVKDLVTGSELRFVDQGFHELKGVPSVWHLFRLG